MRANIVIAYSVLRRSFNGLSHSVIPSILQCFLHFTNEVQGGQEPAQGHTVNRIAVDIGPKKRNRQLSYKYYKYCQAGGITSRPTLGILHVRAGFQGF